MAMMGQLMKPKKTEITGEMFVAEPVLVLLVSSSLSRLILAAYN